VALARQPLLGARRDRAVAGTRRTVPGGNVNSIFSWVVVMAMPQHFRLSAHSKIDVCRGLFAFLVVVGHGVDLAWSLHTQVMENLSVAERIALARIVAMGRYWVMGFFVISGYCIHRSVERLAKQDHFPLKFYLTSRATRILPLYYVAFLFAVA